jgi:hypothetical protein
MFPNLWSVLLPALPVPYLILFLSGTSFVTTDLENLPQNMENLQGMAHLYHCFSPFGFLDKFKVVLYFWFKMKMPVTFCISDSEIVVYN